MIETVGEVSMMVPPACKILEPIIAEHIAQVMTPDSQVHFRRTDQLLLDLVVS